MAFACLLALTSGLAGSPRAQQPGGNAKQVEPAKKQTPQKGKAQQKAKQLPMQRRRITEMTTPDGSRFVLVQDPSHAQIQWAIASWTDGSDDPPELPGLALATLQASLGGTWKTGSKDPAAEKAALQKLDDAWQRQMASPNDRKVSAEIVKLDRAAQQLGDTRTFERVLAALPADQPEIVDRDVLAVLVLTTIEPALADVARLMLERREHQALRGLARAWMPNVLERMQKNASQPRNRLHSEVLALLMPFSPHIARLEAPKPLAPKRQQALATWQASQHPSRVVHVLLGAFDLENTKATLNQVFASTSLTTPQPRPQLPLRPLRTQRRSTIPGVANGGYSIAWVLPRMQNPWALETGRRWLFAEGGRVLSALRKRRPQLQLVSRAPWPLGPDGRGLLLLDVQDASGKPGLLEDVLAACNKAIKKQHPDGTYYNANLSIQRDWNRIGNRPRSTAIELAAHALVWSNDKNVGKAPPISLGDAVHGALRAALSSQPAVVEGQR